MARLEEAPMDPKMRWRPQPSRFYKLHDHVLPDPPSCAKKAHDEVILSLMPDPTGLRQAKWNPSTHSHFFPKFSRQASHFKLDNVCTLPQFVGNPQVRLRMCWIFPRITRDPAILFDTSHPRFSISKEDMWGAWQFSTKLPSPRQQNIAIQKSIKENQNHSSKYFGAHSESITKIRDAFKRGENPFKKAPEPPPRIDHFKKTRKDVEDVLKLDI